MLIKEEDLLNLKDCPVKYKIGSAGYNVKRKSFNSYMHEMFDYMVSYFYFHGKEKLLEASQKKWHEIYANNLNIISEKKWLEGLGYILNIHNHITNEPFKILDVNVPYVLEFPGKECGITGTINMVAEYGEQIIIIDPAFSGGELDRHMIDWDLRYTIYSMYMKEKYNKITVIKKHNYKTNDEMLALRSPNSFKTLELIATNAKHIIENELLIPDYGYHCSTCEARGVCSGWGIKEIKPYNPFKDGRKR